MPVAAGVVARVLVGAGGATHEVAAVGSGSAGAEVAPGLGLDAAGGKDIGEVGGGGAEDRAHGEGAAGEGGHQGAFAGVRRSIGLGICRITPEETWR
jgi:hypothetical protein